MNALLSCELRKLRTLRSTWVAVAVALLLAAATALGEALRAEQEGRRLELSTAALAPALSVWFLVIVVAILAAAGEFQHHTIRTTLLVVPRRPRVLAAKAAATALAGTVLAATAAVVATVAGGVAAAVVGVAVTGGSAAGWGHAAAWVLLAGGWAVLATGLGFLTRSTAMAIAALLLWQLVLEGVLPVVTRTPELGRWLPFGAAEALLGKGTQPLPELGAALLLAGYAAVVCGAAALHFVRRDPA